LLNPDEQARVESDDNLDDSDDNLDDNDDNVLLVGEAVALERGVQHDDVNVKCT
jgi:hypothetical protein